MTDITLTLPDGSVKQVPRGSTPADFARSIGQRLYNDAVGALVNGDLIDLTTALTEDATVQIITKQDDRGREILLHSTAHLLAHAVKQLYPEAKLAIGPALEERFYYDIDLDRPITDEMLAEIDAEMRRIAAADYPVERQELTRTEALKIFTGLGEDYKLEIIAGIEGDDRISVYRQNDFVDLCLGPHLPSTGKIKHF